MSDSPKDAQLPDEPHLLGDINVPAEDPESSGDQLRDDVSAPIDDDPDAAEFSQERYTAGQLNAGQQVAGISPAGEYAEKRTEDLDEH